jgi:hypothetical protein
MIYSTIKQHGFGWRFKLQPNEVVAGVAKRRRLSPYDSKMNRQANASAKSKGVQSYPQANTQLHHIYFCPDTRPE